MGRVNITFGFAAAVCVFLWLDAGLCLWFLLALAVHEIGHLLCMKCSGVQICRMRLTAAGAVISGRFSGYRQEIFCGAAGPWSSFLLCVLCFRRVPELAIVSGILGVVNLLPIYPLDGGRILYGVLMLRLEPDAADRILRIVTASVCCLLMVGACWAAAELQAGLWPVFAALVILWRVGLAGWKDT